MQIERVVRKVLWKLGLDVKRASLPGSSVGLALNLLDVIDADLVLDIGANEGQFASDILSYRPSLAVVSFEPGSKAHQSLSLKARNFPTWSVAERLALGDRPCVSTLRLTQNSQCASLFKVADHGPKLGNAFEFVGLEEVKVERLDQVVPPGDHLGQKIYLKIDVQGFEREVFLGCENLLPHIKAIQVEMTMLEVYQGQSFGLASLNPFIDAGYSIYGIANGWRDNHTGQLIQFDAFLIKNSNCA